MDIKIKLEINYGDFKNLHCEEMCGDFYFYVSDIMDLRGEFFLKIHNLEFVNTTSPLLSFIEFYDFFETLNKSGEAVLTNRFENILIAKKINGQSVKVLDFDELESSSYNLSTGRDGVIVDGKELKYMEGEIIELMDKIKINSPHLHAYIKKNLLYKTPPRKFIK